MNPTSIVLIALRCLLTVVVDAQQCGRPLIAQENRIVGGIDATAGAWPWQVDIQTLSQGHICGGSLISEKWVLSAAHCFPNILDLSIYTIYAGRHQLNGFNAHQSSHRVRRVVVPDSYVEPQRGNDVALVELEQAVTWSDYIRPVCVPDYGALFPAGLSCVVTGWGHIRDQVALPGVATLQKVSVPIIASATCQQQYDVNPTETVTILSDMLCAGYQEGGRDSCQGDSGGPLVCQAVNNTWVQAGVVSFGLGCAAKNRPGVYTKVSMFSNLIRTTVPGIRLYGRAPQSQSWGCSALLLPLSLGHFLML